MKYLLRARMQEVDLSLVIPIYNEEENIEPLYQEIKRAMGKLGVRYEIIMVDDGSTDGGFDILRRLHQGDESLKVIRFRRNFGQTAALAAGFDRAQGRVIVTMDADLQNDPQDIGRLLAKMEEGYDVVSGWRVHRWDPFLTRRFPSIIANWLISEITGVRLHDYGCSLKAYRQEIIKSIRLYGELHRFIPALTSWMGVRVVEIGVNHRPRRASRSKYGLSRTIKVLLDLLTVRFLLSYSTRPIHIFGLLGFLCSGMGGILLAYLGFVRLVLQRPIADRPLLLLAILLTIMGVQMVTMGLLGELVVRTYHESQNKPIYAVREVLE